MTARRIAFAVAVGFGLALAGCGGSASGTGGADDSAGVSLDLDYLSPATPRAEGLARHIADALPAPDPAPRPPSNTWLRVEVTGPDFAPVVCRFPRATGGECGGIPAGSGRVVTVEEWDAAFGTLYFRGQATGVVIVAGRSTRVQVAMRAPVAIQYPAADGGINLPAFTAVVQTEPHALVLLYLGSHLVGTESADEHGVVEIPVDQGGPTVPPREDGQPGLPDGDYLLTAVALPPASPGGTPVKLQGTPHAFAVDLVPPSLALSGPSLTSADTVDIAGVTEPDARVRCGRDRPEEEVAVGADGRFTRAAFPIAGSTTRIVCDATDRAGNVTTRDLLVAFLPQGFAIEASMPDVTRHATETLRVTTDPTVEDLRIDVLGELDQSTHQTIAGPQAVPGIFEVPISLFRNQWNRVQVSARVGGVVLGSVEVAVEHDDVPPPTPKLLSALVPDWINDPSEAQVVGDRLYFSFVTIVTTTPEPGAKIEIFRVHLPVNYVGLSGDGGALVDPEPTDLFAVTETGFYEVPAGSCFRGLLARSVDRAGNPSAGWNLVGMSMLGFPETCVR
ncbi:MAG TPA: hypothetical protein VF406_05700 [Thermodesulfobacteriota bacterium]